jgi:diacylglycerol kinase family enzyme
LAKLAPKVYDGSFVNVEGVNYQQVSSVHVTAKDNLWMEMDGEVTQAKEFELSVLTRAIPFIC